MTRLGFLTLCFLMHCARERTDGARLDPQASASSLSSEGWVLTPMSGRSPLVLPPPCQLEAPAWRSVVAGRSELVAAPDLLGELFVRSGEETSQHLGRLRMTLGQADSVPWSLSRRDVRWSAMGTPWMLVGSHQTGSSIYLQRGATARAETLTEGQGLSVTMSRCQEDHCAVVVHSSEEHGGNGGYTAFFGAFGDPPEAWRRVEISKGILGRRLVSLDRVDDDGAVVALDVDRFVEWQRIGRAGLHVLASVVMDGSLLASALGSDGSAWLVAKSRPLAEGGLSGGIRLASSKNPVVELRAPTPATRATVHALRGGAVVWWLAPRPTGGEQLLLHAVAVRDGHVVGPVAIVAEADEVVFSAVEERIDVWVKDDDAVTYARVKCVLGAQDSAAPREGAP